MIAVAARWLATVLLTLSLCVTASTQTPSQIVPPLPAAERIVPTLEDVFISLTGRALRE